MSRTYERSASSKVSRRGSETSGPPPDGAAAPSFSGPSGHKISIRGMEIQGGGGFASAPWDARGHTTDSILITADKRPTSTMVIEEEPAAHGHAPGQSTWISGVFHLVTVMIGAGVLSLPASFATLGWALGPLLLLVFGAATVWSSYMLSEVFEPVEGKKYYTYKDAVAGIMGGHHPKVLAFFQYLMMFLAAVGYTLAGMTSIEFLATTACTWGDKETDPCPMSQNSQAILLFSGLQLFLNVLPNLESIWWVSAIGATMSYLYSLLAVILSSQQLASAGPAADTTAFGYPASSPFLRAVGMFGALGNLAFAWASGLMIHSIQATLREPPRAVESMRKTIAVSYSSTGCFYFSIACLGYAALGAGVPGDVLTGFDVSKEVELMANAAVLMHMVAAVQVYMHPIYEALEEACSWYLPRLSLFMRSSRINLIATRFAYRFVCTAAITGVGYGLPQFSLISALNGALCFWPLQIGYPFAMYMRAFLPSPRVKSLMLATGAFLLCVCIVAVLGSVYALATS